MQSKEFFNYDKAFERNIGWVTPWEQQILRGKKVAIAGLGGVGGSHLLTLARLGIENFHIADLDVFELANFNRQAGAMVSTIGKSKVESLKSLALDINPRIQITSFDKGVSENNLDDFLSDADLYVDGLDFFVLDLRQKIFKRCQQLKIPAITAAPLGMGVAYQIFMPGKMSFDEYYRFDPHNTQENQIKFLVGLNPSVGHRFYLAFPPAVNFQEKRGPSTVMACNLCSGVVGTEALKIFLGRGQVLAAPWSQYFDAYRNVYKKSYVSRGNGDLTQRIRLALASSFFRKLFSKPRQLLPETVVKNDLQAILDFAKWSPSGDNSQPWHFELKSETEFILHFHNEDSAYDFAGKPSVMTIGFFIETFKIAASHFSYRVDWTYEPIGPKTHNIIFRITKDESIKESQLFPMIKIRSVNRFAYKTTRLTQRQKMVLEQSLGEHFKIRWFESFFERLTIAKLNAAATLIRLSIKETYKTHKHMMDFKNDFSPAGVPIKAAGISLPTQKLLEFGIQSWERVNFMNKFLGGAIVPQIEMDFLPGIFCAAHYIIEWKFPENVEDLLAGGQALQRFWLQLTQLGLVMQPAVATIAFAYYGRNKIYFTENPSMQKRAIKLSQQLGKIVPVNNIAFMGRVGVPLTSLPIPRSVRKDLSELIINQNFK